MARRIGQSIRNARRLVNWTQEQLGRRLGIKGHTIHRWETNQSAPTQRHARELITVLRAHNADAALQLQAAFDAVRGSANATGGRGAASNGAGTVAGAAPTPTVPPTNSPEALELAVLRLADELDLAPRRVRRPLARLFERLRIANFTLDDAQRTLASWIAEQQ